jgi:hypothetical protein
MAIALKRGLNFIINGKAHSYEEMMGIYRKAIGFLLGVVLILFFIGLPLSFYVGFKANEKLPEIRVIDMSSTANDVTK